MIILKSLILSLSQFKKLDMCQHSLLKGKSPTKLRIVLETCTKLGNVDIQ